MCLEGKSDVEDFDLAFIIERVIFDILGKDWVGCILVDDSEAVPVIAVFGLDAVVPEPFGSVLVKVSVCSLP